MSIDAAGNVRPIAGAEIGELNANLRLRERRRPSRRTSDRCVPAPPNAEAKGGLDLSDGGIVEQRRYAGRDGGWGAGGAVTSPRGAVGRRGGRR